MRNCVELPEQSKEKFPDLIKDGTLGLSGITETLGPPPQNKSILQLLSQSPPPLPVTALLAPRPSLAGPDVRGQLKPHPTTSFCSASFSVQMSAILLF